MIIKHLKLAVGCLFVTLLGIDLYLIQEQFKPIPSVVEKEEVAPVKNPEPVAIVYPITPHDHHHYIAFETDLFIGEIQRESGSIVSLKLKQYHENHEPVVLFNYSPNKEYSLRFGINEDNATPFEASKKSYQLKDGEDALVVSLSKKIGDCSILRTITFNRHHYDIQVKDRITNHSSQPKIIHWRAFIVKNHIDKSRGFFSLKSHEKVVFSTLEKKYAHKEFKDLQKKSLVEKHGHWIGVAWPYFMSAILTDHVSALYSIFNKEMNYYENGIQEALQIPPHSSISPQARLYAGPLLFQLLEAVNPNLHLVVDYGFFWFIASYLLKLMHYIDQWVHNWGVTIMITTFLIKLCFLRLAIKSHHVEEAMQRIKPQLEALKKKYPNDQTKVNQMTLEVYRKEKVNPMGGILPVLLQIPVFIAFFNVIQNSIEFRKAPFVLWIEDLSIKDPWYILPVVMGITTLIQIYSNVSAIQKNNREMAMILSLGSIVIFASFPSGLILYWITNNVLGILQQLWLRRQKKSSPVIGK